MARLNIPPHVVDKILNHVSGTIRGVAAIYNRHSYVDERRVAARRLGQSSRHTAGGAALTAMWCRFRWRRVKFERRG